MAELITPRVLKGFRDFLPEAEIERKLLIEMVEATFRSFGFVPIDTPALEYTEILLGKGGGETDKQVYRFADGGGRDVALRFDLTIPFARFMAEHRNELYLPFKRYHIAKVWRGENTQRGRYREFTQCDFDIVGADTAECDYEILALMRSALTAIGVGGFSIRYSHRGIFNRFLANLGIADKSVDVLRLVDKLAKIGRDEVLAQLGTLTNSEKALSILEYIEPGKSDRETLAKLERLAGGPAPDTERLSSLISMMEETGIAPSFVLDPSITRGLDYYTGVVYETFLTEIPAIGSVCSGGRYNNLASLYTKEELPGVGASIGLDRLLAGLEALGKSKKKGSFTTVLITAIDQSLSGHYQNLARRMREAGLAVEVFPDKKKLPQQFAYAEKKGIPFALICGENEKNAGKVTLKNLATRESLEMIDLETAIASAGKP
jgi:histidyl-tRNA synthetase